MIHTFNSLPASWIYLNIFVGGNFLMVFNDILLTGGVSFAIKCRLGEELQKQIKYKSKICFYSNT